MFFTNKKKKYFNKGKKAYDNKNWDEAIKFFTQAVKQDNNYTKAFNLIGNCYLCDDSKNDEDAKPYYLKAIETNKEHPDAYINIADIYLFTIRDSEGLGKEVDYDSFKKAIKWYKKALEADPHNVRAYNNMGHAYLKIDDKENALSCFNKALDIDPNDKNANYSKKTLLLLKKFGLYQNI